MKNKRTKEHRFNVTSFIFLFVILSIALLSIGYAYYSESFSINGNAMVRPFADVRITDVQLADTSSQFAYNESIPEYSVDTFTTTETLSFLWSYIDYNVTIVNESSYPVMITSVDVYTSNNPYLDYTLQDFTLNSSQIAPASSQVVKIRIKYKTDYVSEMEHMSDYFIKQTTDIKHTDTVHFHFYKDAQFDFKVNPTPADALVEIVSNGTVVASGTGSQHGLITYNENAVYTVSKPGYYTKSESVNIKNTKEINVTIEPLPKLTYTLTPDPADSLVTLTVDGEVAASGIGPQTITVDDVKTINYTITKLSYQDKTGSYTMAGANYNDNISLTPYAKIEGSFSNASSSTATISSLHNYWPGYYLVELWGGTGGAGYLGTSSTESMLGTQSIAGYVYGVMYMDYGDVLYYTLGGNGTAGMITLNGTGGANGGGSSINVGSRGGGGGGYSAIMINNGSVTEGTITSGYVKMIAGGAGGHGAGYYAVLVNRPGGAGGSGGQMTSTTSSISTGTVFKGDDGEVPSGAATGIGHGGSTTGGTNSASTSANGSLLTGGSAYLLGGAGGAGYYGGAGGAGSGLTYNPGGAGGGSSYIASGITYTGLSSTILNQRVQINPSSTGGGMIIKYLGTSI